MSIEAAIAAIGLARDGANLARTVGELLGVVESVELKIDLLRESELKTGLIELEQATKSTTETMTLLRSARGRFNKATTMESGHKLCLAYLCLAVCHKYLEDIGNARNALEKAASLSDEIDTKKWALAVLNDRLNPIATANPRWLKKNAWDNGYSLLIKGKAGAREWVERQKQRNLGLFTKSTAFGPTTEKLIEERDKMLHLKKIAQTELRELRQRASC